MEALQEFDRRISKGMQPLTDRWTSITGTSNYALGVLLAIGNFAYLGTLIYHIPGLYQQTFMALLSAGQGLIIMLFFLLFLQEDARWQQGKPPGPNVLFYREFPWCAALRLGFITILLLTVGDSVLYLLYGKLVSGTNPLEGWFGLLCFIIMLYVGTCRPLPPVRPA